MLGTEVQALEPVERRRCRGAGEEVVPGRRVPFRLDADGHYRDTCGDVPSSMDSVRGPTSREAGPANGRLTAAESDGFRTAPIGLTDRLLVRPPPPERDDPGRRRRLIDRVTTVQDRGVERRPVQVPELLVWCQECDRVHVAPPRFDQR